MGNYKPTMRHYTTMDSDKYYELLWQNSGFADAVVYTVQEGRKCDRMPLSCTYCRARSQLGVVWQRVRSHPDLWQV